jgi:hypothetical protein
MYLPIAWLDTIAVCSMSALSTGQSFSLLRPFKLTRPKDTTLRLPFLTHQLITVQSAFGDRPGKVYVCSLRSAVHKPV